MRTKPLKIFFAVLPSKIEFCYDFLIFEIETELIKAEKLSQAEKYKHKMASIINFWAKSGISFLFNFYKKSL